MNGDDTSRSVDVDTPRGEPGMGSALIAVLVMLIATAILCVLIYTVMMAIRPIEARHYQKSGALDYPVVATVDTSRAR